LFVGKGSIHCPQQPANLAAKGSSKMPLLERLQADMKEAMKSGAKDRLGVVRMLLNEVKNIDLQPKKVSEEEAIAAYAKRLRKSQEEYEKLGKADEVSKLKSEIAIVDEYLPKKASPQDTEQLVESFLAANSFTDKQLGQAMGAFMKAHGPQVDPALANAAIRKRLIGA
jgi:hypothetical protein